MSAIDIDTDHMVAVAGLLDGQVAAADRMRTSLTAMANDLGIHEWSLPASTLLGEFIDEVAGTSDILRLRAELASVADNGWTLRMYERKVEALGDLVDGVEAGLDDGVGGDGSDRDLRAHLERLVFGPGGVPVAPSPLIDTKAWDAEHITAVYLDGSGPDAARAYWELLTDEQKYAVIVMAPGAVSDHSVPGNIDLDEPQVFALQAQIVPIDGRQPSTGADTDYAGVPIPMVPPIDGSPGNPIVDRTYRSFAGGSIVCSAIQVFSPIPSRPSVDATGAAASGAALFRTGRSSINNMRAGFGAARVFNPGTWIAAAADVGLCRLRVGSADPISTDRVLDDSRTLVYETSRNENHANVDPNAVTVHPTREGRDRIRWNNEHIGPGKDNLPYPDDQFPVYPENGPSE